MTQKLNRSPVGLLTPLGVARTPQRLINGARNSFVTIVGTSTVTVTVAAATAVLNRGSVFALAEEVGLDENGTIRSLCGGKQLRYWSEMNAPSALTARRLDTQALANGTLPIGVYTIEESCRLHFAHPLAYSPLETSYIEKDTRQSFNVVIKKVADKVANLVTAGPATVVVTDPVFSIIQGFETPGDRGNVAPLFLPTITEQTLQISGANSKLVEFIRSSNQIRGLVLSQEVVTAGGAILEVGDVLTEVGLRGDFRTIIDPPMRVADILYDSEYDFGGSVIASNKSHMGWNFQRYGQLSETLSPAQDLNLRWILNATPSATAGTSRVRTTIFELLRDPRVTAPTIPFPL